MTTLFISQKNRDKDNYLCLISKHYNQTFLAADYKLSSLIPPHRSTEHQSGNS